MLTVVKNSVFAGICVAIAAYAYVCTSLVTDPIYGAIIFSTALTYICTRDYNLYTGKIGKLMPVIKDISYSEEYKRDFIVNLIIMVIINVITAYIIGLTFGLINPSAEEYCENIFNDKLNLGYPIIFIESVFCGIIFYFAIKCYSKIGVISLIMGVVTFIVCGFEHSIANSAYLGISTQLNIPTILVILIGILGNTVGSVIVSRFDI